MSKFLSVRNLAVAGIVLCLAAACSSTRTQKSPGESVDDAVIATKVKADLIDNPATKARDIDVAVFKGRVQLNGFVDSRTEATQAAAVAQKINGVVGVDNNLKVKGESRDIGDVIDDGVITTQVKAALAGDPRTKAYQIEVNTRNGVVQLAGFVDDATARPVATDLTQAVKGVSRVDNQIAVK
jgi:hyperosmotically inducible periplasmic protein